MWSIQFHCIIWRKTDLKIRSYITSSLYHNFQQRVEAHRRVHMHAGINGNTQTLSTHCSSCWTHKQPPLVGLMLHPPLQWPLFLNSITMETGASAAPTWEWRDSFHKGDGGSPFVKSYLHSSVMGICSRIVCEDCRDGFAFWLWCVWPFLKQLLTESPWVDLAPQPVLCGQH